MTETTDRIEATAARKALAEIVGITRAWQFMAEDGYYGADQLVEVLARIEDRACEVMPWLRPEAFTAATQHSVRVTP